MRKVFADAFFFLALLNRQDAWHQKAVGASRSIACPILTTQWILVEVGDAFCHPSDRGLFKKLLELIEADARIHVVGASNAQFQRGLQLYQSRADKAWSLTDCISFVVMEHHGIQEALTGDHHFEQAGLRALLRAE